ncbi:hypothetical protein L486_02442 [Kwoniella mangroviensis CBS 10435]|uniref:Uncharacterized protein n=1 Tax=Kwoniella mangroviensis CBS 10435 TaxID=1331196 RepID=A0A1B9IW54_9TREE|nr:hypothetical protein L486_02442 [Kwoniella mangroviensis CBS 10435]
MTTDSESDRSHRSSASSSDTSNDRYGTPMSVIRPDPFPYELLHHMANRLETGLDHLEIPPEEEEDGEESMSNFPNGYRIAKARVYSRSDVEPGPLGPKIKEMMSLPSSNEILIFTLHPLGSPDLWDGSELDRGYNRSLWFPVYGTLTSIRQAVMEAKFNIDYDETTIPKRSEASKLALADTEVDEMIKKGSISVFVIPSLNVVITVTPESYMDPATRMTEYAAYSQPNVPGQIDILVNSELLGASLLHRSIGHASNTVRDIAALLKVWENNAKYHYSTTRTAEIHRLINHLITCQDELQDLQPVHEMLLKYYREKDVSGQVSEVIDIDVAARAVVMIEQSQKALHRVLNELQRLIERGIRLETFCLNMLSSRANDSMERLAIVTIVFLPLTFMGFTDFSVLSQTPVYFWKISVPLSFVFFFIFAYSNLKRFLRFIFHFLIKGFRRARSQRVFESLMKWWWQEKIKRKVEREQKVYSRSLRQFQDSLPPGPVRYLPPSGSSFGQVQWSPPPGPPPPPLAIPLGQPLRPLPDLSPIALGTDGTVPAWSQFQPVPVSDMPNPWSGMPIPWSGMPIPLPEMPIPSSGRKIPRSKRARR